jgi:hypothetical protein
MLRAMKVEVGDFGRASALNFEAANHVDFRYAAMALYVRSMCCCCCCCCSADAFAPSRAHDTSMAHFLCCRLSTLNFFFFQDALKEFEANPNRYLLPSQDLIRSHCQHFVQPEAVAQFCDLVAKLYAGPTEPTQKAWNFAEHLLKRHPFFLPLRSNAPVRVAAQSDAVAQGDAAESLLRESPSPFDASPNFCAADDVFTIARMFGGVDPSPNSVFQRLIASLARSNRTTGSAHVPQILNLLDQLSSDVRSSNPIEISQKVQFGAFDELIRTLHTHIDEFSVVRKVLLISFQIADSCPGQRHILMHMSHVERQTGESLLKFIVKFISRQNSQPGAMHSSLHDIDDILASADRCIRCIVSSSIPYESLSDFPHTGCYGSPKMESMLSANVLYSIFSAIQSEAASEVFSFLQDAASQCDSAAIISALNQPPRASHWRDLLQRSDSQLRAIAALLKPEAAEQFLLVMASVKESRAWRSDELGGKVLHAFFHDSAEANAVFAAHRRVFVSMIRADETVQQFRRLSEVH